MYVMLCICRNLIRQLYSTRCINNFFIVLSWIFARTLLSASNNILIASLVDLLSEYDITVSYKKMFSICVNQSACCISY